ncbi:MAG: NAD+ synthase [Oscillatoriales cyanobacterium]|nr:MAG: NAD+ synthase [Oscillatoriales cyanobacterium]
MNIAIAQLNPTVGDLSGNADRILAAAHQVTQGDTASALLLTPELSICGYPPRDLLLDPSFIDAMEATVHDLARRLPPKLAVLVGMAVRNPDADREGGKALFNSIALLHQGEIVSLFHKRLLPTYDVFDENRYFEPNPKLDISHNCFTLEVAGQTQTIGVTICEDLWNDEAFWGKRNYRVNPIADLAAAGVDAIVNLSASPYTLRKQKLREAMLCDVAQRYRLPIFYANQVGGNDDLIFDGNSVVVDGTGTIVARAAHCQTDIIDAALTSPSPITPTGAIAPYPDDDNAEIWAALVLGVRDYARKCGFSRAVLGLSGGIDSTLVAAIAAEALGAENVLGVLMSSPYTSQASVDDAIALAENLGIPTQNLPILPMMDGFDQSLAPLFAGTEPGIAEENLQSRIRGTLLMAIANKFGYLLLSTGNKSEVAVGYCTLYGDMNGGLAVIADVPKTRVYALCQWLNRDQDGTHPREIVPRNVLEKPPSAELRPDQRDSDSLPDYDTLDDILDRLVHGHQSADQIIAAGHDRATVERIITLVTRAEFKRRQAAPGLKITDRAFGTGWRMPIAARRSASVFSS